MKRYLFEFEKEKIPTAVVAATAMLIGVFAVGIAVRLVLAVL